MDEGTRLVVTGVVVGLGLLLLGTFFSAPWRGSADKRRRRRRLQSNALGPFDEIWHPTARDANLIWQAQTEAPAPAPLPGDGLGESGRITIRVHSSTS
ncbi:hypothetical protein [Naasia aerilata]|uniref:Uncharacterized protein n=1 Tax=Naasia aerilata TaxID=1162966 RepID=A0ABM8GDZ6_9MICO|nr:hypothetical protein [Naasia aerilata]BDZ46501.1 hypothetical protein GCM10025866_24100 [Naasia aerilata]